MSKYREERLKAMASILKEGNISTQDELSSELANKGFNARQGTISKDLKVLDYRKDAKKGYVKTNEKIITELEDILSRLLSYANPTFRLARTKDNKMSLLYIFSKEGLENSISELISVFYKDTILSTVAGHGCVTVHLYDRKLARKLKKELDEYASMVF